MQQLFCKADETNLFERPIEEDCSSTDQNNFNKLDSLRRSRLSLLAVKELQGSFHRHG